ncbi:WD repeat-containing protein 31-like [Corticium candelabrum]|uniref:WD repeat-containing protein 31-like n=1 Tax=Corticium candelabrum TaxID=121492 RepID=UPI002E27101B|nr:WD repeat-containing protein 31-like [Corticium candelabrum]
MGNAFAKKRERSPSTQFSLNSSSSHNNQLFFHQEEILDVAAVDSESVVIGGGDSNASIVNLAKREATRVFDRHKKAVLKVAYSNELQAGLSSSRDATVYMWSYPTCSDVLQAFNGHSLAVTGLSLNCDVTRLATGSRDNSVMIWDVRTASRVAQRAVSRNIVTHICWCANSENEFVQTSEDKVVRVWDQRTTDVVQQFPMQRHIQTHCDTSDDAHFVLTSNSGTNGGECSVTLWDRRQTAIIRKFIGHKSVVNRAVFLKNKFTGCIASCASDSVIKLWDVNTGNCHVSKYVDGAASLTSLCVVDSRRLVCGSQRRGVNIFEMNRNGDENCTLNHIENL